MKLLPFLCTPYSHAPVYSIIPCKATYVGRLCQSLAVTCHLHFWQNDRDLVRATVVTRGGVGWGVWNGYQNNSQHTKFILRRKFSRRSCRDSNSRPFDHESVALTAEISPLHPVMVCDGVHPHIGTVFLYSLSRCLLFLRATSSMICTLCALELETGRERGTMT